LHGKQEINGMTVEFREITVSELSKKMAANENFAILDVRETWELNYASLGDKRVVNLPTSIIGRDYQEAFPDELRSPEIEIVVMCHHGVRSANVTMWMIQNGWNNVSSLAGGIAAYAAEIDPKVGQY
jgi:rhodanese-related sulfurtransferase